jgi:pimeloyl-ACP methyl ester carboxylesterase
LLAHRFVETNGIRMHYVEAGSGPLVALLHGFPESWYSWRHQLPALEAAGFHAVAPDLRGYGQTDRPQLVEAYDIFQLTGDIVGLVNALGESPAVIVGHDWGAWIAPYAAMLRPDLFRAVALLSVPYVPRRRMSQTAWEQMKYPGRVFYQAVLRSSAAEQIYEADIRLSLSRFLYCLSGDADLKERFNLPGTPGAAQAAPPNLPQWITDQDLDFFESEFKRTGFTGALNYYRNLDRNWAMTPFLDGAKIQQPALFLAGEKDAVIAMHAEEFQALEANVPNLRNKVLLPGTGHWTQQERPDEVNRLLIEFLGMLPALAA